MVELIACPRKRLRRTSPPALVKLPLFRILLCASLLGWFTSRTGASLLTLLDVWAYPRGRMRLLPQCLPLGLASLSIWWRWLWTPRVIQICQTSLRLVSLMFVPAPEGTFHSFKRSATCFWLSVRLMPGTYFDCHFRAWILLISNTSSCPVLTGYVLMYESRWLVYSWLSIKLLRILRS